MDISDFTPRLGKAFGLTHEPISYGVPGSIFLILWGHQSDSPIRLLFTTKALGEGTFGDGMKVVVLTVLVFAVGFGLTYIGDIAARAMSRLIFRIARWVRLGQNSVAGLLEFEVAIQAFKEHFPEIWRQAEKATGDQAVEHSHSIVLTLLVCYTTRFRDLEENWRRWVRNSNFLSGTAAALLLAALLPGGSSMLPPQWAALLGAFGLVLAIHQARVGLRYAARIIAAGYLREKALAVRQGS